MYLLDESMNVTKLNLMILRFIFDNVDQNFMVYQLNKWDIQKFHILN